MLDTPDKIGVTLPATVEQHLWGWNGETFGVTGNYVGVSWFDTKINVPADWRNKRIVMNVKLLSVLELRFLLIKNWWDMIW